MRPTRRLVRLSALWALFGLAVAFLPSLLSAWEAVSLILWILVAVEAVRVWHEPKIRVARKVPHNLPVENASSVEIELHHEGKRPYRLSVVDHIPPFSRAESLPHLLTLAPGRFAQFSYRLTPYRRGDTEFGPVEVRVLSPLGLWARHRKFPARECVKVYPNFARISHYM
ncbi:MAG: hypothetical protein OEV31_04770, partial [Gammaproteobacteria bacterium]|nr:hypothetical protein [Gammaproteobacteria bacterium]